MAADTDAAFLPRVAARLAGARTVLVGVAAALAAFAAAGHIAVIAAAAIFAVVAALVAVAPRPAALQPSPVLPGDAGPGLDAATIRVADALPDPAMVLGSGATVLHANGPARTAFGVRAGDLLAARLRHPDLVAAIDRVEAGGAAQQVEYTERVPTERWFGAWIAPLGAAAGTPAALNLLVIDDQTEAKRTERMRVDFVANASHELRTPLASLAGFVETLQGSARDDPKARERFLAIMHDQATRMSRLIDDLLSLSRIEMKAHVRPDDPVDIAAVLRYVVEASAPLAQEMSVALAADIPEGSVVVPGDRDELVQVFDNLIENACKYGRSGGRVEVRLTTAGTAAIVSVTDHGPGIPAEHLPRLTERFYRVDADNSRRHRGTGLGLAIVKHIVNRHRARLRIESTVGKGSTFAVIFPSTKAGVV